MMLLLKAGLTLLVILALVAFAVATQWFVADRDKVALVWSVDGLLIYMIIRLSYEEFAQRPRR